MKYLLLLLTISSINFLYANTNPLNLKNITIKGKVIDSSTNLSLEYATVILYSKTKNKIIDGTITDINGAFEITANEDIYDIKIEYISYKSFVVENIKIDSNLDLGLIKLSLNLEALAEVEIIAEKTTMEVRLDKKIYNVGKDLTVRGGNVSDVLDNVPSVSVDAEGTIALRGNENVRILINGKPSGLIGLDSSEALQQLPAEAIEKIEVITSPSARYEAEGTAGILNIILRRNKLEGFNGAFNGNVGHPNRAGISGNVNFRTTNLNIFNTLSYRYNESPGFWYSTTTFKATGNILDERRNWLKTSKGITNNFGIEWYINDSASITTAMVFSDNGGGQNSVNNLLQFNSNMDLTSESLRLDPQDRDSKNIQYSFNYTNNFETNRHKLNFDFQFEDNVKNDFSLINVDNVNTDLLDQDVDFSKIFLRTNYIFPLGKSSQFEIGYRGDYNITKTDYRVELLNTNTNLFEVDTGLTNIFNFKNYIHATYLQFGSKINKVSYLLGLRIENTKLTLDQPTSGDFEKRNFTGLFPTINLSYEFNADENLTLGFNRRLSRPRSFFLNPYPSRSSITNIFQGDPGLNPTYSSKIDLGYLNRFNKFVFSSSVYYQRSINIIRFVSKNTGEFVDVGGKSTPVILRTPSNIATENRYGFDFNLTYSSSRKWRINADFNLFNAIIRGELDNTNFNSDNVSWRVRLNNKLVVFKNIDWQINLNYKGPSLDAQNTRDGVLALDLAFSKDLFKEKASITFNVSDLFNSRTFNGTVETEDFITDRELRFRGVRSFNLSLTYRFNQKKKKAFKRNLGASSIDM